MIIKQKYQTFLDEYNKTSNILQSALKAGYSYNYAWKLGKRILNTSVKAKTKELAERANGKTVLDTEEAKQLLCEIIGIDRQLLSSTLKKIALQDKDYSSAIKILSPLAKEAIGLDITQQDTTKVNVPVLNITVDKNGVDKQGSNDNVKDV